MTSEFTEWKSPFKDNDSLILLIEEFSQLVMTFLLHFSLEYKNAEVQVINVTDKTCNKAEQ